MPEPAQPSSPDADEHERVLASKGGYFVEEPTAYAGEHWIEAYAVQGGEVIALAHCLVPIA